ncbi:mate-domain-containing protein [Hyaloraphidium curvatum]|nr:mate-domain-containing protein [Hyaloraphidium curvatum]
MSGTIEEPADANPSTSGGVPAEPDPDVGGFASDIGGLLWNGLPVSLGYLLQVAVPFSNTYFLGTLGTKELASGTLAIMVFNCTGLYVGWGALLAMDTLMSQAVGALEGAEVVDGNGTEAADPEAGTDERTALLKPRLPADPHLLSVLLQRGIVFSFLLTLPIAALWTLTPAALRMLGQDPELASMAGRYVLACALGLFPNLVSETLKKYLQSLGWMRVHFAVQLFSTPQHVALAWFMTQRLGFVGPALTLSVTYAIQPLLFFLAIYLFGIGRDTWGSWFSPRVLSPRGAREMLRLAVPGIFMLGSEYWAYEVLALAAGLISPAALAAQSVILLTLTLNYQLPFGLSIASANAVGNALGAGRPRVAARVIRASMVLGLVYGCVVNPCLLLAARIDDFWGRLFDAEDKDVQRLISALLIPAAVIQPADSLQLVFGGVVRGVGLQEMGAAVNAAAYYAFGLPLALVLAFKFDMGLAGLWIGLTAALYIVAGAMGVHLWAKLDLEAESKRAMERAVGGAEEEQS